MDKYIVGIGEALWDMLPSGKQLGGAPANFAYHMSQFGFNSLVVSAVGEDELGKEITDTFSKKHLQQMIAKVEQPTGTVLVTLNGDGIPEYEIKRNVAWDYIPWTKELERIALNTQAVCFGSLAQRSEVSRQTILNFLQTMPNGENQYKIFDINLRQQFYNLKTIEDSLHRCNILKINDEEIIVVGRLLGYETTDMQTIGKQLRADYGLRLVILTCGTNGSYVFAENQISYFTTPKIQVADTVGAGDSFTAAFCASLLNGSSIADSHLNAVKVSAYICTQKGAMPELPAELQLK